jgi:hypothetical protein
LPAVVLQNRVPLQLLKITHGLPELEVWPRERFAAWVPIIMRYRPTAKDIVDRERVSAGFPATNPKRQRGTTGVGSLNRVGVSSCLPRWRFGLVLCPTMAGGAAKFRRRRAHLLFGAADAD